MYWQNDERGRLVGRRTGVRAGEKWSRSHSPLTHHVTTPTALYTRATSLSTPAYPTLQSINERAAVETTLSREPMHARDYTTAHDLRSSDGDSNDNHDDV